ncbi:MAG TPA: VCBS repeat-containing protein, partial [Saprospiraceae bacterium]|nr:VCBS repeat-containing protein [Saprospiraceae bacterium]
IYTISAPSEICSGSTIDNIIQGDYNADGLMDYLLINNNQILVAFGQKNQTQPLSNWQSVSVQASPFLHANNWKNGLERLYTGDFNADGKTDILLIDGWAAAIYSFNDAGSGLDNIYYTNGQSLPLNSRTFDQENLLWFGDFNGDGHTDVLKKTHNSGIWKIMLSGLNSFGEVTFTDETPNFQSDINITQQGFGNYFGEVIAVGDYNGDGKSDILHINQLGQNTYIDVYYDGSLGFSVLGSSFLPATYIDTYSSGSFTGMDGQSRALYRTNTNLTPLQIGVGVMTQEHLLTKIGNNDGHITSFDYKLMTEKIDVSDDFYTRGPLNDAQQATSNIQLPLWLVKEYQSSNGFGGFKKQNFRYENCLVSRLGKGIMGFIKTIQEDEASYLRTTTTQSPIPYLGIMMPSSQSIQFIIGTLFTSSNSDHNLTSLPNNRYLMTPYATEIINHDETRRT